MDRFFEDFWKFAIGGAFLEIGLVIGLIRTGRRILLYAMLGVALLTTGLIILERLVVTEREKIELVIYGAAQAAEKNDLPTLLEFLSPSAEPLKRALQARLPRYQIEKIDVQNDLTITFYELTSPPTARADFHIVATGGERFSEMRGLRVPFLITLRFQRENGRWLIQDYEEQGRYHAVK